MILQKRQSSERWDIWPADSCRARCCCQPSSASSKQSCGGRLTLWLCSLSGVVEKVAVGRKTEPTRGVGEATQAGRTKRNGLMKRTMGKVNTEQATVARRLAAGGVRTRKNTRRLKDSKLCYVSTSARPSVSAWVEDGAGGSIHRRSAPRPDHHSRCAPSGSHCLALSCLLFDRLLSPSSPRSSPMSHPRLRRVQKEIAECAKDKTSGIEVAMIDGMFLLSLLLSLRRTP